MLNSTKSESITQGIKIEVFPEFVPEQSDAEENKYTFAYQITITNTGDRWAKLTARHWIIIDSDGNREDVQGTGVVGYTPELSPGESFEYTSFCTINTNWGTMEGTFEMMRDDDSTFDAVIKRFFLVYPDLVNA